MVLTHLLSSNEQRQAAPGRPLGAGGSQTRLPKSQDLAPLPSPPPKYLPDVTTGSKYAASAQQHCPLAGTATPRPLEFQSKEAVLGLWEMKEKYNYKGGGGVLLYSQ